MSRKCFLRCVVNSHPPIELPHDVEVPVGRSRSTQIKNESVSRRQITLKSDCKNCLIELKRTGVNASGFDGFSMIKDAVYKVKHGTRVEILLNHYIHIIEFEPPPDGYEQTKEQKVSGKRKLEEEIPSCSKKTRVSSPAPEPMMASWDEKAQGNLYIYTSAGVKPSNKIAAFDMDGTLIKTKSGKVHPVDTNDWQIAFPPVIKKLSEQINLDYKVVILTNQAAIGNGRVRIEDFKKKIENLVAALNIPTEVYISTGKGFYRKPMTGMWHALCKKNNDTQIDITQSFYCGDAAGRLANWAPGKKKDHSLADKLFAENLGLKFYTPEQFFLGHSVAKVPMAKPEFNPKELEAEPFKDHLISKEKEILVLVGFPGSGKSFLAKQIEKKSNGQYVVICRDVLLSWQKCASEAKRVIERGKSAIIDCTNPDLESRARWTSLARELKVGCRCVKMDTTMAHARHNNKFREIMKTNHVPVNDIVFHTYKNKFVEPKRSEGFADVIAVKFSPSFEDDKAEKMYRMHLLEK